MKLSVLREPSAAGQVHRIATVALMLAMMGVIVGITTPGLADTDLGVVGTAVHLPVVLTTAVLYVLVLSPILMQPKAMLRGVRSLAWFAPLVVYSMVSAGWSHTPSITLRRSLFLALTTLTGVVLGTKYSLRELGRMLAAASAIHLLCVAVLLFVDPAWVTSYSDGHAIKGLTSHKNIFGFEAGLAAIVFALVPFQRLRMLRWPLVALAMGMLVLSRSSGSLVATVAGLACLPLLLPMRFRGAQRVALALITVTVASAATYLLTTNLELIPQLLSKDPTLTGRTELWSLVWNSILQRPWLGYGFDSFWMGLQGESLGIIRAVGWLVPTAHNGYLDLLLNMGFVGALLCVPLLFQSIYRALHAVITEHDTARYLPGCFLAFWLVYNLNESALITRSAVPYLLFVCFNVATAPSRYAASFTPRRSYAASPVLTFAR